MSPRTGCALADYAAAKRLPEEFLRQLGIADTDYGGATAIHMPYRDEAGVEVAARYRLQLMKGERADDRFRWRQGDHPCLYGLWRLEQARAAGYVVLVEGESDAHTLWHHEIPALGVPGAANWHEDWAGSLNGFPTLFVVIEPDRGGVAMRRWLARSCIRARARLVTLAGVKDPSELHISDPAAFTARWQAAIDASVLWTETPASEPARACQKSELRRHMQGSALALDDVAPSADAVDGRELFAEIVATLNRYVVLPTGATVTVALWTALTYLTDVVDALPRLLLTSPTKACGKTRLLTLLAALVRRPLPASSITPSATFRAIESSAPTLLLDEMDNARLDENSELRAVLNSGHTRSAAWTVRNVGEQHEPRRFSTWAPVALACIGKLADTVASRCVPISMRRRSHTEPVQRLRESRILAELEPLRGQLARWCLDHAEQIRGADTQVPEPLDGREADNWEPLLAIADAIGGDWPVRARRVAKAQCGRLEDEAPNIQLLADLRHLFAERGVDRLSSEEMLGALGKLDGRLWPEWRDGRLITKRELARLLKPFGIEPDSVRFGDATRKGYLRECFEDAWSRYLPLYPEQAEQTAKGAAPMPIPEVEQDPIVPDRRCPSAPHEHSSVPHVPGTGGRGGPLDLFGSSGEPVPGGSLDGLLARHGWEPAPRTAFPRGPGEPSPYG